MCQSLAVNLRELNGTLAWVVVPAVTATAWPPEALAALEKQALVSFQAESAKVDLCRRIGEINRFGFDCIEHDLLRVDMDLLPGGGFGAVLYDREDVVRIAGRRCQVRGLEHGLCGRVVAADADGGFRTHRIDHIGRVLQSELLYFVQIVARHIAGDGPIG